MSSVKTPKGTELPILKLKGKDYLEVKYRLVWFREEHPDWAIETTILESTEKGSMARAVIRDGGGRIVATGHKSETPQGFADHMEKSETGAIGRALALCGYGTQFTDDLDEGDRIVDAPVERPRTRIYADKPGIEDGVQMERNDLGEFVIQIGKKFAGRKLKDVAIEELQGFVSWLDAEAEKSKKPHAPKTLEFINHATQYIVHMEQQWAKEARG